MLVKCKHETTGQAIKLKRGLGNSFCQQRGIRKHSCHEIPLGVKDEARDVAAEYTFPISLNAITVLLLIANERPSLGLIGNDFLVPFDGQSSLVQKISQLAPWP